MAVLRLALLWAAGCAAVLASEPLPEDSVEEAAALAADGECDNAGPDGQVGCALEALQRRGSTRSVSEVAEEVMEEASEADDLDGGSADSACERRTGKTCLTGRCSQSWGPSVCSSMQCMCKVGFCAQNGKCVPLALKAAKYGGKQYMKAVGAAASAGAQAWGAAAAGSAQYMKNLGAARQQPYDPRAVGGSCRLTRCARSKGLTKCGPNTGYMCKCQKNYFVKKGKCVYR